MHYQAVLIPLVTPGSQRYLPGAAQGAFRVYWVSSLLSLGITPRRNQFVLPPREEFTRCVFA